jgi:hypothetical protein
MPTWIWIIVALVTAAAVLLGLEMQHSALKEWPRALLVATNGESGTRAIVERHGGTYGGWKATVDAVTGEAVIDPDGP